MANSRIREKTLPSIGPDLGTTYNNISTVYGELGEYSKADPSITK